MGTNLKIAIYRPLPRQRKKALLYVMRPTSSIENPVWDLVRTFSYFASQSFGIPEDDGLYYLVMSASGEILVDTTKGVAGTN
jgi:hypothetical protein